MSDNLRHFKEKQLYQAIVTKQEFVKDSKGVETLSLVARLQGELVNNFDPDAGVIEEGVPRVNVEVRLAFPVDDSNRFRIAIKDLTNLGYEEEDLEALNPANRGKPKAKFFELEGKTVYVAPSYKMYSDSERVYWNLRFPKGRKGEEIPAGAAKKSASAEKYKELLRSVREEKAGAF